jgi:hypothetical protein
MKPRFVMLAMASVVTIAAACPTTTLSTGLTGTVLRGPVTPVCQVNVPCDGPFAASFEVHRNGNRVATFTSDAEGRFNVSLAPGPYVIVPASNAPLMNPSSQTKSVEVGPEGMTSVQLMFDTGIR